MAELIFIANQDLYDLYYLESSIDYGSINLSWPRPDGKESRYGGIITKGRTDLLGVIRKDWINDRPMLDIHQIKEYTDGTQHREKWIYKLKTKPFTKKENWIDELKLNGYAVTIKKNEQDLSGLRRAARQVSQEEDPIYVQSGIDLSGLFSYESVIDLHAEALGINTNGKKSGHIINLQLKAPNDWLDKGVQLQVSPLRVIHGVGDGMLRKRTQAILAAHPDVARFNNDYHPRYGHGSTEIILR